MKAPRHSRFRRWLTAGLSSEVTYSDFMLMWNFSLKTNQFRAEYFYIALSSAPGGTRISEQPFYLGFYRSVGRSSSTTDAETVCLVRFYWLLFCYLLRQVAAWCRKIWNANPSSRISIGTASYPPLSIPSHDYCKDKMAGNLSGRLSHSKEAPQRPLTSR